MLARQLRTAVEDHQQRVTRQPAVAEPAHFDLHVLLPVPNAQLRQGRDPTIPRALAGFGGTGERRPEGVFDSAISAEAVAASGHKYTGCRAGGWELSDTTGTSSFARFRRGAGPKLASERGYDAELADTFPNEGTVIRYYRAWPLEENALP
jgi:hypothetical protein